MASFIAKVVSKKILGESLQNKFGTEARSMPLAPDCAGPQLTHPPRTLTSNTFQPLG